MAGTNIETRIRGYSNEQLQGIRRGLQQQLLDTTLGFANIDTIFAQMRFISTVSKKVRGKGFMEEDATEEDVVTTINCRRGLGRVNRLLSLDAKLAFEEERRSIYGRSL